MNNLQHKINYWWEEKPLQLIIALGLLLRILAAIFSKGFGMHDDHFLVIEAAQSWIDDFDYNDWLPSSGAKNPSGHSFFYCGIHYYFFKFLEAIGIFDPQLKMYIVRFLHALYSLLTIVFAFKITEHYANKTVAKKAALILSILWFMPMFSVRNLVEVVCVPVLLYATWLIIKAEKNNSKNLLIVAGLVAGLAFSIRFQSLFFVGGFGLYFLLNRKCLSAILFGIGAAITIVGIQGTVDYITWGRPFAEFGEYVNYNINNANTYSTQPWYTFFITIAGILLPPVSLFLLFGYFKNFRKNLLLFLPSFIFLAFHCYFPNKQERFIFPVIPFVVILGMIGWEEFISTSKFWIARPKALKRCWNFFWILNILPLLFITFSYSKRNRVEAMLYLQKKGDVQNLIIEDSNRGDWMMPPLFYLKKWISPWGITEIVSADSTRHIAHRVSESTRPNYVLFMQADNLEKRVQKFKTGYGDIVYETQIEPGAMDELLHWLNPNNENHTTTIYKITSLLPDSVEQKPVE